MKVSIEGGSLVVRHEDGDPRITGGSWGSAESHLLHHVKGAVREQLGIELCKVRAWKDNQMFGDHHTQMLRPPAKLVRRGLPAHHNIAVVDGGYAVRDAARRYRETGVMVYDIVKGYWSSWRDE